MVEIDTYARELPALIAQAGEYAVLKGDKVLAVKPTYDEALAAGYAANHDGRFVAMRILPSAPEVAVPAPQGM